MKLIMAISEDGYVANGPEDDMLWTGSVDKAIFRLLTSTSNALAASSYSCYMIPNKLPGRGQLYSLSTDPRRGMPIEDFSLMFPDAWLLGGQTLALYALKNGLVNQAYLSRVPDTHIATQAAIPDKLTSYFCKRAYKKGSGSWWENTQRISIDKKLHIDLWERESAIDG